MIDACHISNKYEKFRQSLEKILPTTMIYRSKSEFSALYTKFGLIDKRENKKKWIGTVRRTELHKSAGLQPDHCTMKARSYNKNLCQSFVVHENEA